METTHGKTHSENGEGRCWWSRIASPYPDANNVALFFTSIINIINSDCQRTVPIFGACRDVESSGLAGLVGPRNFWNIFN